MRFEFNDDSQKICNSADVVNYGIQCDICGNKFQSVSNINGKRYCVGCYYKTFMKDNQQTEIDQLKQQLAEKEKRIAELEDKDWYEATIKQLEEQNGRLIRERDKYELQLKEKDKEIVELNKKISLMEEQDMIFHNQLAISELEKVGKWFMGKVLKTISGDENNDENLFMYINNRLKELKGEKDEV